MDKGPVFVVGMNGSGTTMLVDCLGRHPELYAFPREVRILPHLLERARALGGCEDLPARRVLADELGRSRAVWEANGFQPLILSDAQLCEPGFRGVVNAILMEFALREGKRQWIEKSPGHLAYIADLAAAIPSARFIHIIRDGRDCAQSFQRRFHYDPEVSIFRWRQLVAQGREQGQRIGKERYIEIFYEALTSAPEAEMKRLCHFLEVDFVPGMLESSMRMADPRLLSGSSRIVENSEKWRQYFTRRQVERLEAIAGATLAELGYSVTKLGSDSPPVWRRRWSRLRGRLSIARDSLRKWGWRAVPTLLRAARVAVIQDRFDRT